MLILLVKKNLCKFCTLFRGELILSEVTGREEMYYPTNETRKKIFMVSVPVTIACLRYISLIDFTLANRLRT